MRPQDYWNKRAEQRMLLIELMGNKYAERIYSVYKSAWSQIEKDVEKLLDSYMRAGDLTAAEAKRFLMEPITPKMQLELFNRLSEVSDPVLRRKIAARMNAGSVRARLTRMTALQDELTIETAKAAPQEIALDQEALRQSGQEMYYRTIFDEQKGTGVGSSFSKVTLETLDNAAAEQWEGGNFSSRVWKNTEEMAQAVAEIVRSNITTGRSPQHCIAELRAYMNDPDKGAVYKAMRLLRTEMNRMANLESARASMENGAERYEFIAKLDLKTSEPCREHDGLIDPHTRKPYFYSKMKVGENFPPLHPWCRSVASAVVDEDIRAKLERRAINPVTGEIEYVPANMTYKEWYAKKVSGDPEAQLNEKAIKNTSADSRMFERYQYVLGKDAPKTLAEFQRMKYTDEERWSMVRLDYRRRTDKLFDAEKALPNAATATAADEKFTKYLFGGENPRGLEKGKNFAKRMGYDVDNWESMRTDILQRAPLYPAKYRRTTEYGDEYEQPIIMYGPKKAPTNVVIGWYSRSRKTWMTSAYIKEVKKQ